MKVVSGQVGHHCTSCQHDGAEHLHQDRIGNCRVQGCDCEQYRLPSVGLWAGVNIEDLGHLLELSTDSDNTKG